VRFPLIGMVTVAAFATALAPAGAALADMNQWFLNATALRDSGTPTKIAAPDFLLTTSFLGPTKAPCTLKSAGIPPIVYGTWQLAKYDRKHHIALAYANTDQEAVALFAAPPPAVSVPDADLATCGTGRGLHLGSPYSQVRSTYSSSPVAQHGRHFVTSYDALVPDVTISLPHRQTLDAEKIVIVIDDDRVSSILVAIRCCNG
jgi:hypothetical protein